jgi:hypothetical protein
MQTEKRLKNHYRRWNINLSEDEEFSKFKNRLISALESLAGTFLVKNFYIDHDFLERHKLHKAEEPVVKKSQPVYPGSIDSDDPLLKDIAKDTLISRFKPISHTEKGFGDTNLFKSIDSCNTSRELATVIQIFFWILEEHHDETKDFTLEIIEKIRKISKLTPSSGFQISRKGKQAIIYPYGDEFLDKGIVDYVISGLDNYPKAAKQFEEALKIYQRGEENLYRSLLDNLRLALEELLREVLSTQKTLENQRSDLKTWLTGKGLHINITSMYDKLLFDNYCKYQNNAVKHHENYSLDEVEFMIYLTGSFIRLILQLKGK